ncbi:MAG: hydrogenase maturation protease [Chlorobi bacterium]|nr:hydrogenase maturation protease [Chlorobiota bacterium]
MNSSNHNNTIIFGIGNSARQDDGLGWAFLDKIGKTGFFGGEKQYCYQLNIEDAEILANYDKVFFVDAYEGNDIKDFKIEKCKSNGEITYTTHALSPDAVLALCENIYKKNPEAYIIKIKGYKWNLEEGISEKAKSNLKSAIIYFRDKYF